MDRGSGIEDAKNIGIRSDQIGGVDVRVEKPFWEASAGGGRGELDLK